MIFKGIICYSTECNFKEDIVYSSVSIFVLCTHLYHNEKLVNKVIINASTMRDP